MTTEKHKQYHKKLHKNFDELLADFIAATEKDPTESLIFELIEWSYKQTVHPDHIEPKGAFID